MRWFALAPCLALVSCASIVSKSDWPVVLDSNPTGATLTIKNDDLPDLRAQYIKTRVRTANDKLQIRVVSTMPSAQAAKTETGFEAYLVVRSSRAALNGR